MTICDVCEKDVALATCHTVLTYDCICLTVCDDCHEPGGLTIDDHD